MKVVFLPKPKPDKTSPKSYRPITLSSFLLKGLERIIQWHWQETVLQHPLPNQHAYTKSRSCETALSTVVERMERGKHLKEHTLLVSLDCSGAFDNLTYESAVRALRESGVSETLVKWYHNLLNNRTVDSELYGLGRTIRPSRGSPQGGVLSPLVWNLAINGLLRQFREERVVADLGKQCIKAVGYADDVLLLGQGNDPKLLVRKMQRAINRAVRWAQSCGLDYNPQKTECCFIHPGYKNPRDRPLRIGGTPLVYTNTIKYLGLTLDKSLSWKPHIEDKCLKAKRLLHSTMRAVGREWGLTPDRIMWVHKAIVRPQISYGSLVWAHKLNYGHKANLRSVQRQALLPLAHVMRSTPTAGMEVTLGIPPLHLHCQEVALRAAYRLHVEMGWRDTTNVTSHRAHHLRDLHTILPTGSRPPPLSLRLTD